MHSFVGVRDVMREFVNAREWNRFHTPRNVMIALAAEVGEVGEIFQWKGALENGLDDSFDKKQCDHIGEEIADVSVYTARLCDLCNIDLAESVYRVLDESFRSTKEYRTNKLDDSWKDFTFEQCIPLLTSTSRFLLKSPRDLVLRMQKNLGLLSECFLVKSELDCASGLQSGWSSSDIDHISLKLGTLFVDFLCLGHVCQLDFTTLLEDKIAKNNAKYPADRCKGKATKYTAYSSQTVTITTCFAASITSLAVGVIATVLFYSFRRK